MSAVLPDLMDAGFEYVLREDPSLSPADIVTLDEAKDHLKLDGDDDDSVLNGMIEAVTLLGEAFTAWDFRIKMYNMNFTNWPADNVIRIPKNQTTGGASLTVKQFFSGSFSVTVPTTVYRSNGGPLGMLLTLKSGQEWPDHSTLATDIIPHRIKVTFETRPADVDFQVIPLFKLGVLTHLAHVYEHRGDCDLSSMPGTELRSSMYLSGAAAIYAPYRIPNV